MSVTAEPFTAHILVDLLRVGMIAAALLLIVLVLRIIWTRRGQDPTLAETRVHPATMLSYCGLLGMLIARRTDSLGTPPDPWLIAAVLVVGLGYYGVLQRVDLNTRPPWRR